MYWILYICYAYIVGLHAYHVYASININQSLSNNMVAIHRHAHHFHLYNRCQKGFELHKRNRDIAEVGVLFFLFFFIFSHFYFTKCCIGLPII